MRLVPTSAHGRFHDQWQRDLRFEDGDRLLAVFLFRQCPVLSDIRTPLYDLPTTMEGSS